MSLSNEDLFRRKREVLFPFLPFINKMISKVRNTEMEPKWRTMYECITSDKKRMSLEQIQKMERTLIGLQDDLKLKKESKEKFGSGSSFHQELSTNHYKKSSSSKPYYDLDSKEEFYLKYRNPSPLHSPHRSREDYEAGTSSNHDEINDRESSNYFRQNEFSRFDNRRPHFYHETRRKSLSPQLRQNCFDSQRKYDDRNEKRYSKNRPNYSYNQSEHKSFQRSQSRPTERFKEKPRLDSSRENYQFKSSDLHESTAFTQSRIKPKEDLGKNTSLSLGKEATYQDFLATHPKFVGIESLNVNKTEKSYSSSTIKDISKKNVEKIEIKTCDEKTKSKKQENSVSDRYKLSDIKTATVARLKADIVCDQSASKFSEIEKETVKENPVSKQHTSGSIIDQFEKVENQIDDVNQSTKNINEILNRDVIDQSDLHAADAKISISVYKKQKTDVEELTITTKQFEDKNEQQNNMNMGTSPNQLMDCLNISSNQSNIEFNRTSTLLMQSSDIIEQSKVADEQLISVDQKPEKENPQKNIIVCSEDPRSYEITADDQLVAQKDQRSLSNIEKIQDKQSGESSLENELIENTEDRRPFESKLTISVDNKKSLSNDDLNKKSEIAMQMPDSNDTSQLDDSDLDISDIEEEPENIDELWAKLNEQSSKISVTKTKETNIEKLPSTNQKYEDKDFKNETKLSKIGKQPVEERKTRRKNELEKLQDDLNRSKDCDLFISSSLKPRTCTLQKIRDDKLIKECIPCSVKLLKLNLSTKEMPVKINHEFEMKYLQASKKIIFTKPEEGKTRNKRKKFKITHEASEIISTFEPEKLNSGTSEKNSVISNKLEKEKVLNEKRKSEEIHEVSKVTSTVEMGLKIKPEPEEFSKTVIEENLQPMIVAENDEKKIILEKRKTSESIEDDRELKKIKISDESDEWMDLHSNETISKHKTAITLKKFKKLFDNYTSEYDLKHSEIIRLRKLKINKTTKNGKKSNEIFTNPTSVQESLQTAEENKQENPEILNNENITKNEKVVGISHSDPIITSNIIHHNEKPKVDSSTPYVKIVAVKPVQRTESKSLISQSNHQIDPKQDLTVLIPSINQKRSTQKILLATRAIRPLPEPKNSQSKLINNSKTRVIGRIVPAPTTSSNLSTNFDSASVVNTPTTSTFKITKVVSEHSREQSSRVGKIPITLPTVQTEQQQTIEIIDISDEDDDNDIVSVDILRPWIENPKFKSKKNLKACKAMINRYGLAALFKCMGSTCCFYTSEKEYFQIHLELHRDHQLEDAPNYLLCSYCEHKAYDISGLITHITLNHGGSIFSCTHCFFRSLNEFQVTLNHFQKYHANGKKEIIMFNPPVKREKNFDVKHVKQTIGHYCQPLTCIYCPQNFYIISAFVDHLKMHPEKNLTKCMKCYETTDSANILMHYFNCYGFGLFQCVYCNFGASTINLIDEHLTRKHPDRTTYFISRQMNESTNSRRNPSEISCLSLKEINKQPANDSRFKKIFIPNCEPTRNSNNLGNMSDEKMDGSEEEHDLAGSTSTSSLIIENVLSLNTSAED